MKRLLLPVIVVGIALVLVAVGSPATPRLSGVDGPGFTITLKSGGKLVKTLPAGIYTLAVTDKSAIHNFHLLGPGVNKTTTVPFTGAQTWIVKLKAGTYTYQCDVHAATGMKGTFKVT